MKQKPTNISESRELDQKIEDPRQDRLTKGRIVIDRRSNGERRISRITTGHNWDRDRFKTSRETRSRGYTSRDIEETGRTSRSRKEERTGKSRMLAFLPSREISDRRKARLFNEINEQRDTVVVLYHGAGLITSRHSASSRFGILVLPFDRMPENRLGIFFFMARCFAPFAPHRKLRLVMQTRGEKKRAKFLVSENRII